jgi:ABC-2 type transport system permease protein
MSSVSRVLGGIKRQLALLVVAPFLIIATLFLLLAQGLHQFPIAVFNGDKGFEMPMAGHLNIPETLVGGLNRDAFRVTVADSPTAAQALYDSGKARAILIFPAELTQNMMIKLDDPSYALPDKIRLQVAGDNPLERLFVMASIGKSSIAAIQDSGGGFSADSLPVPIDIEALVAGFESAPTYMLSIILGFLSYILAGILALFTALSLKKEGSFRGAPAFPTALAFVLAFGLAGWILYLALVSTIFALLGMALTLSIYLASTVILLLACAGSALALTVGTNAASPEQARPLIPYFILPIFVGGILFPVQLLPAWLQWLPFLFPPFYGLKAAAAVELGRNSSFLPWSIGLTGLWVLAFLALGAAGIRKANIGKASGGKAGTAKTGPAIDSPQPK